VTDATLEEEGLGFDAGVGEWKFRRPRRKLRKKYDLSGHSFLTPPIPSLVDVVSRCQYCSSIDGQVSLFLII
jgi:hypothetical protein